MSSCPECAKWKEAYHELALAIARRDGYFVPTKPPAVGPDGRASMDVLDKKGFPVTHPALPLNIMTAIEETTEPFSDARTAAIEAARALLANSMLPDDVESQLRMGDDIKV